MRQLIDIKRRNKEAKATYFEATYGEVPVVVEKPTHEEDKKKIQEIWSRMHLFSGKNFGIWSIRMQSYLCFADSFNDLEDEAKEALTIYLIQQVLDNNLLHKVAVATTSNEAWCIMEIEYS